MCRPNGSEDAATSIDWRGKLCKFGKDQLPDRKWLAGVDENANFDLPISLNHIQTPSVKVRKRDRLRAERIAAAGGPMPTLREHAVRLVEKLGEARTRDLTEIGIPRCYLTRMCEEGLLIKVGYGRYRAAQRRAA